MNYLRTYIAPFAIVSLLISCNKESIIEGTNNEIVIIEINKTYPLSPTSINNFSFQVGQYSLTNSIRTTATKGITSTAYSNTDSVRITDLFIQSGVALSLANISLIKYNRNDVIPVSSFSTANSPFYIQVCKKPSPYTSPYIAINSSFIYNGVTIQPQFAITQDAYMAFRLPVSNGSGGFIYYYGWIHFIIGQNTISIDKVGYKLNKELKAGEE